MDFTPRIETAEISDSDLDSVSGGLQCNLADAVVANVTGAVDGIAPVTGVSGSAAGCVESAAGLNTAAVTGFVAGL
ncbi:type A2 lantipeptide [Streptomyces sp. PR69]|uniref:type A2 lantipeptide n=1 Tax=Streptomyces sp. PR69 TaxID=2984950 RepID=UPI0022642714|nr:type A2 lantipeptide [Streptomyces sp. PR69]